MKRAKKLENTWHEIVLLSEKRVRAYFMAAFHL